MRFDEGQLAEARTYLLGEGSDELIRLMQAKGLARGSEGFSDAARDAARVLGWIAESGALTGLGICTADSCREYRFWLDRDRSLPFEGAAPYLSLRTLKDRSVLEIGSGAGMNLMSILAAGGQARGVEPVEAYAQLGAVFCEREGLAPPDVRQGVAEALPFKDNTADLILCVTAHQYFDLKPALAEIARVLRPGGELIIIGNTLGVYARRALGRALRRPGQAKAYATTVTNTLSYMVLGRRIVTGRGAFTTAQPVYPTRSAMRRFLREVGLTDISPVVRVGPETCFRSRLPPSNVRGN